MHYARDHNCANIYMYKYVVQCALSCRIALLLFSINIFLILVSRARTHIKVRWFFLLSACAFHPHSYILYNNNKAIDIVTFIMQPDCVCVSYLPHTNTPPHLYLKRNKIYFSAYAIANLSLQCERSAHNLNYWHMKLNKVRF